MFKFLFFAVMFSSLFTIQSTFSYDEKVDRQGHQEKNVIKPYDLTFIDEMTEHHRMGVMMAEIAVKNANSAELRKLAEKMVAAQASEIKLMQSWRKSWYPAAHPFMSHDVGMRMEKLENLSGLAFDLAFLDGMIMHHPGAIYLGHESQTRAYHSMLKQLGNKILASQIKELNQMRTWRHQLAPIELANIE